MLPGLFCLLVSPALAESPIKIGIPVGLSGANSVVAPSVVQSAELAVEVINKTGGVLVAVCRETTSMKNRPAFCKPPLIRTHLKAYQFQRKSRLECIQLARRPDTT